MICYSSKLERFRRSPRAAMRIARGVALLIGIAIVCAPHAHTPNARDLNPREYAKTLLTTKNYNCLNYLYGKESAWNYQAIGNLNGKQKAYGIPQIKNDIIKDKSAVEQVTYGLKYIGHRYGYTKHGQPNACKALKHWKNKGWH